MLDVPPLISLETLDISTLGVLPILCVSNTNPSVGFVLVDRFSLQLFFFYLASTRIIKLVCREFPTEGNTKRRFGKFPRLSSRSIYRWGGGHMPPGANRVKSLS